MLIGIIVTGHGNFASGLASSIEVIAGKQDKFEAIDFPIGSTNTELAKQLQEAVDRLNCSDIIFCTDIAGGTPFNQSVILSTHLPNSKVISGTNVPVLLEALFSRANQTALSLSEILVDSHQSRIQVFQSRSQTKIAIKAQKIFTADFIESNKYLVIDDNKFAGFFSKENVEKENIPVKEYNDAFIIPGLIDTHIHGAVGHDTMDSTPEALKSIGDYLLTQGTTTWMPTTVTAPLEDIYKAIANVAECKDTLNSARILGMFIEGPYITSKHKGAHPEEHIRPLNKEEIEKMAEYNTVKSIIIAPEKEDAPKFTKWITQDLKIKVSLGHSSANYEEACACFDMGADAGVHTYCAMEQLHHRNPNLLGAIMTRNDVYAELIADGIHVSLPAMKILLQNKPKDKALLVSDAIQGTGLKDGRYMLGTLPFNVKDGIARIDSGNLAGSTTTLLKEVRRLILELHENPIHAVNMASLNPAKRFGVDDELGSIASGKKADFLIRTPDYELKETWLDGKCVFKA